MRRRIQIIPPLRGHLAEFGLIAAQDWLMSGRPIARAEDCMDAEISRRASNTSMLHACPEFFARLADCGGITLAASCGLRVTKSADVAGYVRRYVKSQRNDIESRKRLPKLQQDQLCDC